MPSERQDLDTSVFDTEWEERAEAHVDAQLAKQDDQIRRFDKLLDKWEEQARRQDAILDAQERQHGIRE